MKQSDGSSKFVASDTDSENGADILRGAELDGDEMFTEDGLSQDEAGSGDYEYEDEDGDVLPTLHGTAKADGDFDKDDDEDDGFD